MRSFIKDHVSSDNNQTNSKYIHIYFVNIFHINGLEVILNVTTAFFGMIFYIIFIYKPKALTSLFKKYIVKNRKYFCKRCYLTRLCIKKKSPLICNSDRWAVTQWIRCLPHNLWIVCSNPTRVITMIPHQYLLFPESDLKWFE